MPVCHFFFSGEPDHKNQDCKAATCFRRTDIAVQRFTPPQVLGLSSGVR